MRNCTCLPRQKSASASCAEATAEAIKAAKQAGCLVSFDVNYRSKLWTEEEANKCLVPMMENVDILITTEEDTGKVFGIREADKLPDSGRRRDDRSDQTPSPNDVSGLSAVRNSLG